MELEEKLKNFAQRITQIKSNINTEEATKTSIIMPFFQILGYDVFNPNEFIPEYIADVGIKRGEKVDYAIVLNNEVVILIEAKSINENLNKHDSQLFRYFGTSAAKFAILTNGIIYKFYTDLEKDNVMDTTPFLEINLESISNQDINELKKFQKDSFNMDVIINSASELKYSNKIRNVIKEEFNNPSDEFVKVILNHGVYDGIKTQIIINKYRNILKKSLNNYINDILNSKIQNAINNEESQEEVEVVEKIITTDQELEAFYIIKSIFSEYCDVSKIYYKDTESYFAILFDNKVTKWICRIYLRENVKYITIPNDKKEEVRYDIEYVSDIYKYKVELLNKLNEFYNIKELV